jgi:hypothetical protein
MKRFYATLILYALGVSLAEAAVRSDVPMQGGMLMPQIKYTASPEGLSVTMPANTPQLTPLLVSNPDDRFDPADPWYEDLDPAARGWAFNRQYGFVMDGNSDLFPTSTRQLWMRKVSGPDALRIYRYHETNKQWQPIFGTEGSPLALEWNRMMFHPAFAAPAGTNGYAATFEAYLVDADTGEEVPDSSVTMEFAWTNVPDGRPALDLGMAMMIDWDPAMTNYVLESTTDMDAAEWSVVTNQVVQIDGRRMVLMRPAAAQGHFFRLRRE